MDTAADVIFSNSPLTANYMPRLRIEKILDRVTKGKLVYVIAGAGYGKTQAVYNYVQKQKDAVVRWLQLSESDNIGFHYWENLTRNISFDNPVLAGKLRALGFPETLSAFRKFAEIIKSSEHHSQKTFLVLDDFHLIHSKQALTFAERCAYLEIPGACVIIISRKRPEINDVSLFAKGKAGIITEEELRFTDSEASDYMRQRGISLPAKNLPPLLEATKGWALAIKLLSLVLERMPNNLNRAIGTMKQNINKLLEVEAFNDFPETVRKTLVQLSLISDLPLSPVQVISRDAELINNIPQLAAFMWFDSFIGDYRIHPLYLEFLQSKRDILSDEEVQDTYRQAAKWCADNDFQMDAMNYYEKSRQYGPMLELLLSNPFKLPPDACGYYLGILERMDPENKDGGDRNVLLLKNYFIPSFLIGMGKYDEARELCFDIIREWESRDTHISYVLLAACYSKLAYIEMYICTASHKYDFPEYLKKSVEYYQLYSEPPVKMTGSFAVADIRSFACLVGEGAELPEFDLFIEKLKEAALYIPQTYHKMYDGYIDLAGCEIAFFRNQLNLAGTLANNAIIKAREKKQYSIEIAAQQYLMRIAIHNGDYTLTKETLKQLRDHLQNINFWNRQLLYELISGSFYIHIGLPDMASSLIAIDERETASEVRIPIRELILSVRYYLACKKYHQALAVLCNSYPRAPRERFLFGELVLSLLMSASRFLTGDTAGAVREFESAYQLSFNGEFEMPFIELGRLFHQLAAAAAADAECRIPEEWLAAVERKASVYAKKTAVIANAYRREKRIAESIHLSEREQQVLDDLYHGLSREEIAANRYLSVNTIKKVLQSIYIKLDAKNNVDAIRIGLEKKLIG